jgi:RNA polymerase sigma factor (sigma-70 family)
MDELSDIELLGRYAREGTETAFAELVRRHLDMAYSAALREARGDSGLAQEIAQSVFVELARKAKSLANHPALAGWIYTCVRHMAANARRAEARRLQRELEAQAMRELHEDGETGWAQLRDELDDAIHDLEEADRTAVALRFLEGRSHREVGGALGVTENAARMRVDRALEKLREAIGRRGIKSTASALTAAMAAGALTQAPSGFAAMVTATAVGGAAVAAASGGTFLTTLLMSMKAKAVAVVLLVALAAGVPVVYKTHQKQVAAEAQMAAEKAEMAARAQELDARAKATETATAEVERLRESQAKMQTELSRLRGEVTASRQTPLRPMMAAPGPANTPRIEFGNTNLMASAQAMMKNTMEQQALGKLTRLKEKLNLTPEQSEAVKKILIESATRDSANGFEMLKSGKPLDPKAATERRDPEKEIKALLTPEQASHFGEYKTEEQNAMARALAGSSLVAMQNAVGLTPDQQDKVFTILYDQTVQQLNPDVKADPKAATFPTDQSVAGWINWQADRTRENTEKEVKSLEGILSPEQLANYRKFKELQIEQSKAVLPMFESQQKPKTE